MYVYVYAYVCVYVYACMCMCVCFLAVDAVSIPVGKTRHGKTGTANV